MMEVIFNVVAEMWARLDAKKAEIVDRLAWRIAVRLQGTENDIPRAEDVESIASCAIRLWLMLNVLYKPPTELDSASRSFTAE